MYMCVHRIHNRKKWKFHAPYARAPYLNTPIYMRKRVKPSTSAAAASDFSLIELESRFLFQDYSSNPISNSEVREERARKRESEQRTIAAGQRIFKREYRSIQFSLQETKLTQRCKKLSSDPAQLSHTATFAAADIYRNERLGR